MKLNKTIAPAVVLTALGLIGSNAQAMIPEAGSTAAPPASSQQPPAAAPSATSFSDVELEQYVRAALAVQRVQQDQTTPDTAKQTKMADAVQQEGLSPERFNEVASAAQADPALQQRIQAVAAKVQGAGAP
ncbi:MULTISPECIES: DUF4168 domain-containing protein [unclassified Novosphingobium]|uniref:DUF4168 domain-containing protein n=1 Tax=unclassified Novosphingobium TaxID=2644732 RepID=UPI001F186BDB|nr:MULTISPECIES: DUF4168 domain-containing protein [unclassified Novosphingobium]